MRYLVSVVFTILTLSLLASEANAQVAPECSNIYNGPGSCQESTEVTLRKQIQDPETGDFVDSLSTDQPSIAPGSDVVFRITVTNTKAMAIEDINLKDVLPDALENIRPQKGEFNPDNNTLSYYIARLEPEASDTLEVHATLKSLSDLPDSSPLCVTNVVTLDTGVSSAADNVQFCIGNTQTESASTSPSSQTNPSTPPQSTPQSQTTKGGKEVASASNATTAPNTGPGLVSLVALLPAAMAGYLLRRQTSK